MRTYELKEKYVVLFYKACDLVYNATTGRVEQAQFDYKHLVELIEEKNLSKRDMYLVINYYCKMFNEKYTDVMQTVNEGKQE